MKYADPLYRTAVVAVAVAASASAACRDTATNTIINPTPLPISMINVTPIDIPSNILMSYISIISIISLSNLGLEQGFLEGGD